MIDDLSLDDDETFPASSHSLGALSSSLGSPVWLPLSHLNITDTSLATVTPCDLSQGQCPDCFFIATVTALAAVPRIIQTLFLAHDPRKSTVQFYVNGIWTPVVVNDLIPCTNGAPLFVHSAKGKTWPHILEKAYAKLYGSYSAIAGGNIGEALMDLTGLPVEDYTNHGPGGSCFPLTDLAQRLQQGDVSVAGSLKLTDMKGLKPGHAYTVVGICKCLDGMKGEYLLHLLDPQRSSSWRGEYSNRSSKEWTPAIKKACPEVPQDGSVFICAKDFEKYFQSIHLCRTSLLGQVKAVHFHGHFPGPSKGGCTNFTSFRLNDQYDIMLEPQPNPTELFVILSTPDRRRASKAQQSAITYPQIGLTIVAPKGDPSLLTAGRFDITYRSTFWNKRDVSAAITLPAIRNGGATTYPPYILLPSTFRPGESGPYLLTVLSLEGSPPVTVTAREEAIRTKASATVTFQGAWAPSQQGGGACGYSVIPSGDGVLYALLLQQRPQPAVGNNVKRSLSRSRPKPPPNNPEGSDITGEVYVGVKILDASDNEMDTADNKMVNYTEVWKSVPVVGGMVYKVFPICGRPGTDQGEYTLTITTMGSSTAPEINKIESSTLVVVPPPKATRGKMSMATAHKGLTGLGNMYKGL